MSVNRPCFKKVFPPNDQTRIFFAATAPYFEARKIQRNGPMWTKASLPNHGMGSMKPNQSTCLLGLRAVFCIFATLCGAHVKRAQKHNDSAKKKARKVIQFAFSQEYGKIRNFFTKIRTVSLFVHFSFLVVHYDFRKKCLHWRKSKKTWTFAPGFLEYFSAIFSRYFLLGRWTKTPAALQVKTNKLLWWGKTIPTQKWLDKMCMLENYVAYINANNFAYDFSALDLQYLIPCVCSIKHTAQQKLCICS